MIERLLALVPYLTRLHSGLSIVIHIGGGYFMRRFLQILALLINEIVFVLNQVLVPGSSPYPGSLA